MLIDLIVSFPSMLFEYVDIVEFISACVVFIAIGFIGSLVSNRNL